MNKIFTVEQTITDVEEEDNGAALITLIEGSDAMFVRLQSWDTTVWKGAEGHETFRKIMGKRVRVTVELLED